jgi:hypothetical protein
MSSGQGLIEQVKNDLGQQIRSVGNEQMVAREQKALAERMEQCIDMAAQGAVLPGPEAYQEQGPRQALSSCSPALSGSVSCRAQGQEWGLHLAGCDLCGGAYRYIPPPFGMGDLEASH